MLNHVTEIQEVEREPGLYASAIMSSVSFIVTDAKRDPRTLAHSLVAGDHGSIEQHDKRLADVYDELYQRAIDTGAHPNDLAVSGSMKIDDDPGADRVLIRQLYLHDGFAMDYAQKSAAQIGICSLHLFQRVFKERFSLLGLTQRLQELKQGLWAERPFEDSFERVHAGLAILPLKLRGFLKFAAPRLRKSLCGGSRQGFCANNSNS